MAGMAARWADMDHNGKAGDRKFLGHDAAGRFRAGQKTRLFGRPESDAAHRSPLGERLRYLFSGLDCDTAHHAVWRACRTAFCWNAAAAVGFDVLIAVDQIIPDGNPPATIPLVPITT